MKKISENKILIFSVILFLASLAAPAFWYDGRSGMRLAHAGFFPFVLGPLPVVFAVFGIPQGLYEFVWALAWLANPLLFLSWIAIYGKAKNTALLTSLMSLGACYLFRLTDKIPVPDGGSMEHLSLGLGYYLWVLSTVLAIAAAIFSRLEEKKPLKRFDM